jgi:hypothetical protein
VAMYLVRALAAGAAIGMVFLIDRRQTIWLSRSSTPPGA